MKWFFRSIGWLAMGMVGVGLLWGPIQEKRLDQDVRKLLLEVQEALQEYHVAEEQYPLQPMTGSELVSLLEKAGYLDQTENPWGDSLLDSTEGEDWLRYHSDQLGETYQLTALYPESEEVHLQLDSIEHQSLEEG